MEIIESVLYNDFCCQAGECPDSCCQGWTVPLTKEDRERFLGESGLLGWRLKYEMALSGGEQFNLFAHRCTFFNKKGLCSLQECRGKAFIPETCRNYPRFCRNYGSFEERYIDLSCIYGAKLFCQSQNPLKLCVSEGTPESSTCSTNDDGKFLEELRTLRGGMIKELEGVQTLEGLSDLLERFFLYCGQAQTEFAKGQTDFFVKYPYTAERCQELSGQIFPFPAPRLKAIMGTSLYHFRLRFHNPRIYALCRSYFGKYGRMMNMQEKWEKMYRAFVQRYPLRVKYYAQIYGYYLLQHFLGSYEDYSFRRHAGLGIVHLNLILLFEILYEKEHGELNADVSAGILSAYIRRAYYNSDIPDELYAAGFASKIF